MDLTRYGSRERLSVLMPVGIIPTISVLPSERVFRYAKRRRTPNKLLNSPHRVHTQGMHNHYFTSKS